MTSAPAAMGPIAPTVDYPPDIELVRQIPISISAGADRSAAEWLMSPEASRHGLAELLDGAMVRLVHAGLPIDRGSLHMRTLHPQLIGFSAAWRPELGVCDEVRVHAHLRETDLFQLSPLRPVLEQGKPLRIRGEDRMVAGQLSMIKALAAPNFTDYCAFPLPHWRDEFNIVAVSTRAAEGFTDQDVATMKSLLPAFALNLEIVALARIAENVLAAYLGERSGGRVLAGDIRRGAGEMIDAIVWVSDMRGYTKLSDRLAGPDMIRLLNAYFERLVEAIHAEDGEVLKFIGDGMLAIFPLGPDRSAVDAAEASLRAAKAGLAAVRALNGADGHALQIDTEWRPIDMAIALHRGPVFFGNIGAADRLDFTVTGPAVNLAARVEPLAKETGHRLLMTKAVAELLDGPLDSLGSFVFRGLAEPVAVFAAPE